MGGDLVVFGFSSMDGFHVEGMAEDEGDVLLCAEVSDPVPGEHTFDSDGNVLAVGVDEVEKGCWVSIDVLVKAYLAFVIKDADVHFFGMKVDSAIKLVLFGVKSHMGFLLSMVYGFVV